MKRQIICAVIIGMSVLLTAFLIKYFDVGSYFSLERIQGMSLTFKKLMTTNYLTIALVYILMLMSVVAVSIPAVGPLTLLGGYVFGVVYGALYALTGYVLGALIAFFLFRYGFGAAIQRRYADRLVTFNQRLREDGVSYMLMLHFSTVIPFGVINALAAMTPISWMTFAWVTALGSLPYSLIYAFAGKKLATISSLGDIFSPGIMLAFGLLMSLSFLPVIIKRVRNIVGR